MSCSSAVPGCLTMTHPRKVGQGHTGLPQDTPVGSCLPVQLPAEARVTAAETLVQGPARMERKGDPSTQRLGQTEKVRGFVLTLLADVATCLLQGSQLCWEICCSNSPSWGDL